jgi:DNA-binding MarR family transcriptional regulator/GNAT superfamily N-acetyltransferase
MIVHDVREFSRFYTGVIGALDYQTYLGTPYSLTEARLLYELAQHEGVEVTELRAALSLDAGYLSRILARFEERGLVTRERSAKDARQQVVTATEAGRAEARMLTDRSNEAVGALVARLTPADQERLAAGMRTVREVLEGRSRPRSYLLREPGPGDLGWVVQRHGALYAAEHGCDSDFEAGVAADVGAYARGRDPRRERGWIAEVDGEPAGCVFCTRDTEEGVAKLRFFLVEPKARGLGIGSRLLEECLGFARGAGYRAMRLWTFQGLDAAHHLYRRAGFVMTHSYPHEAFGRRLTAQEWSLTL